MTAIRGPPPPRFNHAAQVGALLFYTQCPVSFKLQQCCSLQVNSKPHDDLNDFVFLLELGMYADMRTMMVSAKPAV